MGGVVLRRYRLALFDDHPIVLAGLVDLIGKLDQYDIVCTGTSAQDVMSTASSKPLDLVLMDLQMPGDAFAAIRHVVSRFGAPQVLVFTASDKIDDCSRAFENGARGYVVKGSSGGELFHAIKAVVEGQEYISSSLSARMIRESQQRRMVPEVPAMSLSHREDQIVRQLMQGASNRDIARKLQLSEKTVKSYMTQIMQKFNARSRLEVVLTMQKSLSVD